MENPLRATLQAAGRDNLHDRYNLGELVSTNYSNLTSVLTEILTRLQQETSRNDALAAVVKDRDSQIISLADKLRHQTEKTANFEHTLSSWKVIIDNISKNQQNNGLSQDTMAEEVATLKAKVEEQDGMLAKFRRTEQLMGRHNERSVAMESAFDAMQSNIRMNREHIGQQRIIIDALQRGKANAIDVMNQRNQAEEGVSVDTMERFVLVLLLSWDSPSASFLQFFLLWLDLFCSCGVFSVAVCSALVNYFVCRPSSCAATLPLLSCPLLLLLLLQTDGAT